MKQTKCTDEVCSEYDILKDATAITKGEEIVCGECHAECVTSDEEPVNANATN